jgi:hypothetical protein
MFVSRGSVSAARIYHCERVASGSLTCRTLTRRATFRLNSRRTSTTGSCSARELIRGLVHRLFHGENRLKHARECMQSMT